MPLVSIVTPSFNQGGYIQAALDSVLKQDEVDLELIVMDGGSTDETVDILRQTNDPRLIWKSEQDLGQSHALNKGFGLARGEYLSYLNSDDLLLPGAVRFALDYLVANHECDLVYGDCSLIDEHGQRIGHSPGKPYVLAPVLRGVNPVNQPGAFWRRRLALKVGEFSESLRYTMDYDYWLRAGVTGFRLDYVAGERSAFRMHAQSKTTAEAVHFWRDREMVIESLYAADGLPKEVLEQRKPAFEYVGWLRAKRFWLLGEFEVARPALVDHLLHGTPSRRLVATLMLVDSYLKTPFTRWLNRVLSPSGRAFLV